MEWDVIDYDKGAYYILHNEGIFRVPKVEPADYKKLFITVSEGKLRCFDPDFEWMYLAESMALKQQVDEFEPDILEYVPVSPSKAWQDGRALRRVLQDLLKVVAPVDAKAMVKAQPMTINIDSLTNLKL